jgi:hypothetical protein
MFASTLAFLKALITTLLDSLAKLIWGILITCLLIVSLMFGLTIALVNMLT